MASTSPFQQAKELGNQIDSILAFVDADDFPAAEREAIMRIKHLAADARLEIRDYDYAETRADQTKSAVQAKKYLERLQASIVKASESGIFGAADTAILSATIQQIISDLQ